MCARQAMEETSKSIDRLPADKQARVEEIRATFEWATRHINCISGMLWAAQVDATGHREALPQNMMGQDKTAPALSPTDARTGRTAEGNAPAPSNETQARTPERSASRPQTLARPRPSWER
jgi:hypothetical protein